MGVHNITSTADFNKLVTGDESDTLIVIDAFATWCGPCKAISPVVAKYSDEYTNAIFYKIDVDEVPDVAQELGIRAMPTFLFFKKGEKIGEVVGANPQAIQASIQKYL